jgi:hypothetical protein
LKLSVDYTALDNSRLAVFDDDEEDMDQLINEAEEADSND